MPKTIDEIYTQIVSASQDIDRLPIDHPDQERLQAERGRLREAAAAIASTGRHPLSIEREIESLQDRLEEIKSMRITEGYQERRGGKNLQDPSAYSSTINRLLEEHHLDEVSYLTDRIAYLTSDSPGDDIEDAD